MRATDIERALLTGRVPNRTEETRSMGLTQIELHAAHAQIDQAKSLARIADALERIAALYLAAEFGIVSAKVEAIKEAHSE